MTEGERISRIRRVHLRDFRGFVGGHELDTDADIVLLEGPNGHGKTSLLEALTLLLTGWHFEHDPVETLLARRSAHQTADEAELEAAVSTGTSGEPRPEPVALGWSSSYEKARLPRPEALPPTRLTIADGEERHHDAELEARLCAFFQDRVDRLFDEASSGATLRDVFEPLPPIWRKLPEALHELGEVGTSSLQKRIDEIRARNEGPPADADKSRADLAAAYAPFRSWVLELARGSEGWPPPPEALEEEEAPLGEWAVAVLSAAGRATAPRDEKLPTDLFAALREELQRQVRQARRHAADVGHEEAEKLRTERERWEAELSRLEKAWPALDEDLALFEPSAASDDPGLLDIFRGLARHAHRWGAAQPSGAAASSLARPLEEVQAVLSTEAGKCAEALEDWLRPRREAAAERERLGARLAEVDRRLARAVSSEELDRLRGLERRMDGVIRPLGDAWRSERDRLDWERGAQGRARAIAHLEAAVEAVAEVEARIQAVGEPDADLMGALRDMVNQVAGRFSLVKGVLPLDLDPLDPAEGDRRAYRIVTADGRNLTQLSTGQRGQVAVAFLMAQNLAVSDLLSHQVILLDDVTTAYDLSNLTREAILWRQVAYGASDPGMRRQVFISSHHEDLTNHLLDLLVPPKERSLRLLRFKGWTAESGPDIESFEVEPTGAWSGREQGGGGMRDAGCDERLQGLIRDLKGEQWELS